MKPDSFVIVVKYDKDDGYSLEVMLDDALTMCRKGGDGTVKEILEFLQEVIILQFCRSENEDEAPLANRFSKIMNYMNAATEVTDSQEAALEGVQEQDLNVQ